MKAAHKNNHHLDPGQGEKSPPPTQTAQGGEGYDSKNITMLETLRIISINTKQGWIPLSLQTCRHTVKDQSTEKKETIGHKREVSWLDQKSKGETAKARAARVGSYPRKEDVDRRPTTTVRAHNWKRLFQDNI